MWSRDLGSSEDGACVPALGAALYCCMPDHPVGAASGQVSPSPGPCRPQADIKVSEGEGLSLNLFARELCSTGRLHQHFALLGWTGTPTYEQAPFSVVGSVLSGCAELHSCHHVAVHLSRLLCWAQDAQQASDGDRSIHSRSTTHCTRSGAADRECSSHCGSTCSACRCNLATHPRTWADAHQSSLGAIQPAALSSLPAVTLPSPLQLLCSYWSAAHRQPCCGTNMVPC